MSHNLYSHDHVTVGGQLTEAGISFLGEVWGRVPMGPDVVIQVFEGWIH